MTRDEFDNSWFGATTYEKLNMLHRAIKDLLPAQSSEPPCVGADETAETLEVRQLRSSLRLAEQRLGESETLEHAARYTLNCVRHELRASDRADIVHLARDTVRERDEAKLVAAQLTTRVADLEAKLATIPMQMSRAVMAEREACAAIAEAKYANSLPFDGDPMRPYNFLRTDSFCAVKRAIRNRPVPDGWTPPNGSETAKGGG